jgi:hypothetical protein
MAKPAVAHKSNTTKHSFFIKLLKMDLHP